MRHAGIALLLFLSLLFFNALAPAQDQPAVNSSVAPPPHAKQIHLKHILVVGETKGWEHESVSDGMAAIYNMGHESGLWDATLRTDTELITKKDLGRNAKNLEYFDALVFVSTTGELDLDDSQKKDMMSFIKDDGKGFVGVHAALDTNYKWPEYGEMIGGWFDEHPWFTFNAPIVNEDPDFPAVRHFPKAFVKYDEIYQPKQWSRDKVNVLLSLDPQSSTTPTTRGSTERIMILPWRGTRCTARVEFFIRRSDIPRSRGKIPTFARCILKRSSGCWG